MEWLKTQLREQFNDKDFRLLSVNIFVKFRLRIHDAYC